MVSQDRCLCALSPCRYLLFTMLFFVCILHRRTFSMPYMVFQCADHFRTGNSGCNNSKFLNLFHCNRHRESCFNLVHQNLKLIHSNNCISHFTLVGYTEQPLNIHISQKFLYDNPCSLYMVR